MHTVWAAISAAFALGAAHALEVDHMVAVSAFVGNRPRIAASIGYGLRWGLGHAAVVFLVGSALTLSGLRLPPSSDRWAEMGVGVILIALGLWAIRRAARLHVHAPGVADGHTGAHVHLHVHDPTQHPHHHHQHHHDRTRHRHLSTLIGAAHGLAGTGPIVALIPVAMIERPLVAVGYLAAFGVGTMLAMATYAALAAVAVGQATRSQRTARLAATVTGVLSLVVGVWWVVRAIA